MRVRFGHVLAPIYSKTRGIVRQKCNKLMVWYLCSLWHDTLVPILIFSHIRFYYLLPMKCLTNTKRLGWGIIGFLNCCVTTSPYARVITNMVSENDFLKWSSVSNILRWVGPCSLLWSATKLWIWDFVEFRKLFLLSWIISFLRLDLRFYPYLMNFPL